MTLTGNNMNHYAQMVADLAKPGEDIIESLTPMSIHTLHMAVGLMGEVTELKEHQLEQDVQLHSTILEELGDIEFYFEGLSQSMSVLMEPSPSRHYANPNCVDRLVVTSGEMLDLVKKMVIYNKPIDVMDFIEKLILIQVQLNQVYLHYDITQDEARAHNMNKLLKGDNARYKDGSYSDEAAQLRRDKETQH